MFGSNILDIAIGLVFVFLLLSLICSAVNELLELALKKRAKDLETGIGELVGDPENADKFLQAIYDHGLVNGLYKGPYKSGSRKLPSYIPAPNFALALMEVVAKAKSASAAVKQVSENASPNPVTSAPGAAAPPATNAIAAPIKIPANVESALEAFATTAENDAKKLQASLEAWYDSAMDRVSGWYKRRTQIFILFLGVILAIAVNADCIEIVKRLSRDSALRQSVVAMAEAEAKKDQPKNEQTETPTDQINDRIQTLEGLGLPIGWPPSDKTPWQDRMAYAVSHHWLGWLLTAFAVSLGAPFWFDLLNKIIVVRSTVKPHEKSKEEGSKDPAKSHKGS